MKMMIETRVRARLVALALLLLVAAPAPWAQPRTAPRVVEPGGWCPLRKGACGIRDLPWSVVEGIIHVESGGWPFALAVNKGRHHGFYPETREEAELMLKVMLAWSDNVGIGLMQINWRWWGQRMKSYGLEPRDLLNPRINIEAGCVVLREVLLKEEGSFRERLGRYHTRRRAAGRAYAARVMRVAREVESSR